MVLAPRFILLLVMIIHSTLSWSLTPTAGFVKKENFGSVTNYHDEKRDVDVAVMTTELKHEDIVQENVKEITGLFETKKEYGKVFGFKDWTPGKYKLIEEKSDRFFILEGTYKDARDKIVHFLEVYWANPQNSGQYVITSNSRDLKIESYKEFLKQ